MFQIETTDTIYETEFYHIQTNITSRCNMRCEHCRGAYVGTTDLAVDDFKNLLDFVHQHVGMRGGYLITGGEPLLHPQFKKILSELKGYVRADQFVAISTNGTFLNAEFLDFIQNLEFPELRISISLDSIDSRRHNLFRHSPVAYEGSIRAIKLIAEKPQIKRIVRTTIQKDQLEEIEPMAEMVESMGVDILSISSIIPAGRAKDKPELWFDKASKKNLIELVAVLRKKHRHLIVDVNDPLFYIGASFTNNCGEYGGCIAGIGTFSLEPNGDMLPCPVLHNQIIMNIRGMKPEEILRGYSSNHFVHTLLERNLKGKCGSCKLRFACGGCRARAEGVYDDYLAEDPDCWL